MTYKVQIDDLVREATKEEAAAIKANEADKVAEAKAIEDKLAAKAAIADRLGLTPDELALLLA
jgi:hypothetical protein